MPPFVRKPWQRGTQQAAEVANEAPEVALQGARQAVRQPAALPPSRVGTRKDPRSFSDRRQQGARPRREKGDVQFRKSGVVLPFLSGARAPGLFP